MLTKISETRLENGRRVADFRCDCGRRETWPVTLIGFRLRQTCSWCTPLVKPFKVNKADTQGETAIIYLEKQDKAWTGALVDFKDFPKVSQYFWQDSPKGPIIGGSRAARNITLARIVLDFPEGKIVYQNGNPYDCRRVNLAVSSKGIPPKVGTLKAIGEPFARQEKTRTRKYIQVQCEQCGRTETVVLTNYTRGKTSCRACSHTNSYTFAPGQCTIEGKRPVTFFFSPQDQQFFESKKWGCNRGLIVDLASRSPAKFLLAGRGSVVIDGDELNLRRENLRAFNPHSRVYKDRIRGISFEGSRGTYHVTLCRQGKRLASKHFHTLEEAVVYHVAVSNRFLGLDSPYWNWSEKQIQQLAAKARDLPAYKVCPVAEL